jgi:hypothetical protein
MKVITSIIAVLAIIIGFIPATLSLLWSFTFKSWLTPDILLWGGAIFIWGVGNLKIK